MKSLSKLKTRFSLPRKSKRQDGREEEQPGSSGDQTSTLTVADTGPANASHISTATIHPLPEQSTPSDSHLPPVVTALSPSTQPSTQPMVSSPPTTTKDADPWALAYDIFRKEEPDLMEFYSQHLRGNNSGTDLSNRQSVEAALTKLSEDRENKQWHIPVHGHDIKIRVQVEKLAKFVQWFDPFVKAAVSSQPYAALGWSGVSLLLPLLTSSTTHNEEMLKGFNSIGDLQLYWKVCEEVYLRSEHRDDYQNLIEPLAKLYSQVLIYQASVLQHLSKPQSSRAWQSLAGSDKWASRLKKINSSDEHCRNLVNTSLAKEIRDNRDSQLQEIKSLAVSVKEFLGKIEESRQDEKETRLLQDLAAAAGDYQRYKDLNPNRVPGTCEWFLTDERFCKWRDSESSNLLWVSAGPGCGKSVLSKCLIDERHVAPDIVSITPSSNTITVDSTATICYFFFKDGGEGPMDGAHALCATLHQLFTSSSTSKLIKYALQSHKDHGATLTKKFSELWKIFLACITSSDAGKIICVLDALDECQEESRKEIIGKLRDFYSQSGIHSTRSSKVKFLATSRPYFDLEKAFERFSKAAAYLHFDGDDKLEYIRQEINLVIDARLQNITTGFNRHDQEEISNSLKSMEHRTYLWLYLTFDIIDKSPARYGRRLDIEEIISNLPSKISDAYEKILSRSTDQSWTEALLRIILAAERPLTLDEANVALTMAVTRARLATHEQIESKLWPRNNFASIVTTLCGQFVRVYDSKLAFIHQTAKEFLTCSEPRGEWEGRFSMTQAHSALSGLCLRYLFLPDMVNHTNSDSAEYDDTEGDDTEGDDTEGDDENYPFLDYAAKSWPLHFVSQEAADAAPYRRNARILCSMNKNRTSIWLPRYFEHRWWVGLRGWTDLTLALYLGLNEVVQDILLLERGFDIDNGAPLSYAARNGHEAIVTLLLEKGANKDRADV